MTNEEFQTILADRISKIESILASKAKEYAREDRLHNFKRAAVMLRCTPERALLGMMAKHLISILDIVDSIDEGEMQVKSMVDEKIGDAINYLILLEALIKETGNIIYNNKG
jgi:hypothetical protein